MCSSYIGESILETEYWLDLKSEGGEVVRFSWSVANSYFLLAILESSPVKRGNLWHGKFMTNIGEVAIHTLTPRSSKEISVTFSYEDQSSVSREHKAKHNLIWVEDLRQGSIFCCNKRQCRFSSPWPLGWEVRWSSRDRKLQRADGLVDSGINMQSEENPGPLHLEENQLRERLYKKLNFSKHWGLVPTSFSWY